MWWIVVAFNLLLMLALNVRFLNYIQLDGYRFRLSKPFYTYYAKVIAVTFVGVAAMIAFYFIPGQIYIYLALVAQLLPIVVLIAIDGAQKRKTPLVVTKRVGRYYLIFALLALALSVGAIRASLALNVNYTGFIWACYLLLPILNVLTLLLSSPIENAIKKKCLRRAKEILDERVGLIKIGITGSYGKTTIKEYLNTILSVKYNTLASPASYNTPMGLVKTLNLLKDDTQILIMEMGARRRGDIKTLCDIFKPSIGIVSGIAPQHIETFGTLEAIVDTKYELIEGLKRGGFAVFNGENDYTARMSLRAGSVVKCLQKVSTGRIHAENVSTTCEGTRFELVIDDCSVECTTDVIGVHNLQNILMAVAVADRLGMNAQEIAKGISMLKSPPHRLEVIRSDNGVIIIDDSYNCNTVGAQAALDTLKLFNARKVIATQGIVEMGDAEAEANYQLGAAMSAVADLVIAIGERGAIIRKGLLDAGYNPTKIISVNNLMDAQERFGIVLKSGDVLLLMNDLPDNY